ncbi:Fasciclin-like arabinogalactan [Musa troglodytarum]|uniref:Fasciclin-like arabinogalactan n=1 Tax=Musa troglodytarum TaxID=320322 RepID=A0A9E7HLV0_9LILI|nr:Fasciclin-like arabinogalactan [Musa troglodytarum]
MTSRPPALFVLFFFFLPFLLFPLAASHNITRILAQFDDFSTFSSLLTQAQLVSDINSRRTITVLAVDNGAVSSASGRPIDELKKILSLHVVLDYYDDEKLHNLRNHTAILTTLFQATGLATGRNGFLNVTNMGNGQIAFGSAVPGSPLVANFVKVLATRPYNISVIQISSVIVPPSISGGASNHSTSPTAAPVAAPSPANATLTPTLAPSEDAPSPTHTPVASPPGLMSPDGSPAGAPSGNSADAPAGDSSAAERVVAGAGVAIAMAFAMLASLQMS